VLFKRAQASKITPGQLDRTSARAEVEAPRLGDAVAANA
jgi:hypothetical protein